MTARSGNSISGSLRGAVPVAAPAESSGAPPGDASGRIEERLHTLVDSFGNYVWQIDEGGRYTYLSAGVTKALGYAPEALIGKTPFDIMTPEEAKRVFAAFGPIAEARMPFSTMENKVRHCDGHEVVLETSGLPMIDAKGVFRGYYGIDRDITVRRRSEEALHRLNRTLRTLSSGNGALVRATDERSLLQEMCRIAVEIGGYRLAWVGWRDDRGSVTPIAVAGADAAFIEGLDISWLDPERDQDLTGTAIRTGDVQIICDNPAAVARKQLASRAQNFGYHCSIALPLKSQVGVFGALTIYSKERDSFGREEVEMLTELAASLGFGIAALRDRAGRRAALDKIQRGLEATIEALANTVELRDPYTAGHQREVSKIASAVARRMKLAEDQIQGILLAGIIHDVGKIQVPAEILSKPGKLTPLEFEIIKEHARAGYDIVKGMDFPWPIADMILQHHERLDGSGYPQGLKGDQIMIEARILAVADTVEAMTSHRPYRAALGLDAALAELERGKGRIYDKAKAAVEACVALFREDKFPVPGARAAP